MPKRDTIDNSQTGTVSRAYSTVFAQFWRWAARPSPGQRSSAELVDQFLQAIIILSVGLTPLLFSQLSSELFEFPKMVLVYALSLAGLILLLIKWTITKRLILPGGGLAAAFSLLIVWMFVSGLLGLDFYTSFAGYYTRFNGGIASYLAYGIVALVVVDQLATLPQHREQLLWRLSWAWLGAAALVAVWGILEHFGHDPSCLILAGNFSADCWVEDVQARVFATFGQPNWLATYLISAIPLGLVMTMLQRHRAKYVTAGLTVLAYAAFWYTFSRSGWFGLLGALLVLVIAIPWELMWKQKAWLAGIFLSCLIISATSFNFAALRAETSLSGRGADSSTGSIRLLVWEGALRAIAANPVFGSGPATFAYSFLPYRPVGMNLTTEWNFLYNEAHNQVLNTAVTIGIPGLLLWLSLFITPLGFLLAGFQRNIVAAKNRNSSVETRNKNQIRNQQASESRLSNLFRFSGFRFPRTSNPAYEKDFTFSLSIALASGMLGIFISQLFGFAVVMTNLLLFVALGILAAPLARTFTWNSRRFLGTTVALGLAAILAGTALIRYTAAELASTASAGHTFASLAATSQGKKAVGLNPWEPTYRTRLANAYINASRYLDQGKNLREADRQLRIARQLNPHDLIVAKNRAYYYQAMSKLDPSFGEAAIDAAKQAVQLAPTDADAVTILAGLLGDFGLERQALAQLDRLVRIRPTASSFAARARAYQRMGNMTAARNDAAEAVQLDPKNPDYAKLRDELGV